MFESNITTESRFPVRFYYQSYWLSKKEGRFSAKEKNSSLLVKEKKGFSWDLYTLIVETFQNPCFDWVLGT